MNIPIKLKSEVQVPPTGYAFPFIDKQDMQLKAKLSDGIIVNYTNVNEDTKILLLEDYTAFEVFAHDYDIPAKTLIADTPLADKIYDSEVLSDMIYVVLPACMVHSFKLRTMQPDINKSDVVIDWGDGTILPLKDNEVTSKLSPEISEGDYTVTHTYSNTGKYVVKIFGKDYYNFVHSAANNILCRIFDNDLPIAPHLGSLANSATGSNHLLFVSGETIKYRQWSNLGGLCSNCKNLLKATSFSKNFVTANCRGAFQTCSNLKFADMQVPFKSFYPTAAEHMYNSCSKLSVDIATLIPDVYLEGGPFSLYATFNNTKLLTGTVPADKLWKNKNASFLKTGCFGGGVNADIKAQVPVSWGGTNQNIDNELLIEDKNYYTAFQVFAHDYDIPVGDCEELGGYVNNVIPANLSHKMYIRSFSTQEFIDVIIDWGDGNVESLKELSSENISYGTENQYYVSHIYSKTGKYIVKIYGKDYWAILPDKTNVSNNPCNLICRVFDQDLPIAKHLYNLSSFCYGAIRLLNVNIWQGNFNGNNIQNTAYLFCQCRNLISATGFYYNNTIQAENNIFENCWSLQNTDYQLHSVGSKSLCFHRCRKLSTPIEDLLPNNFNSSSINLNQTFNECKLLTGTIPTKLFWNNQNTTFKNYTKCFNKCSDEIKLQVPESWGGTASDDIIEPTLESRIKKLEDELLKLKENQ